MSHRELLPIPPIDTATDPVYSAADMRQRWRALMGPLGFGERQLWFAFMGPDRRLTKVLSHMAIGTKPEPELVEKITYVLHELLKEPVAGSTVALLLTRPGRGGISESDRQWSRSLAEMAARFDVPIEPIFRANDESLVQVEPAA